jgi:uncharacterized protein (TIGR02646 family)
MILLRSTTLSDEASAALVAYQADVDAAGDYAARVQRAAERFESRNKKGSMVFDQVKKTLATMCSGSGRCAYCEDSAASEVEHVRPKSLYPEATFSWPNYVFACGPCNRPKSNRFAVFPEGQHTLVEVSRKPRAEITPPLPGDPVFLDPRAEDAMKWIMLDLLETFRFRSIATKGTRHHQRASYTIETLKLNRDVLLEARKQAFEDYLAQLDRYVHKKRAGASVEALAEIRDTIACRQHPTVWREMQRQHDKHDSLRPLFAAAPEAACW